MSVLKIIFRNIFWFLLQKKNCFRVLLFLSCLSPVFSQTINSLSGTVNSYTPVTLISSCSIEVSDPSAFAVGNRVLIIQMKGAVVDTTNTASFGDVLNLNNCGNYEFSHISDITGNTIYLTDTLQRLYDVASAVQLIRVPKFVHATVTSPITCPVWNGSVGGVIAIECSGIITFNNNIDAKGKGFALGNVSPTGYNCPGSFDYFYPSTSYFGAEKGEGVSILSASKLNGMGKRANGGGGGNNVNAGGGGGGNFGAGGNGGYSWEGCPVMDIGGRGGQQLSYTNILNKVFLGGGGGGGQQNNLQATPGTNGGGIVIVRANSVIGNGYTIDASTFDVLTGGCDGTGGGGGGGTVLLDVDNFTGILNVNVKGGDGAFPTCYLQGASGGGGGGCVWSKTTLPANVSFNVSKGLRGVHGGGSQDGLPGDTLSGLTIVGTPFLFDPNNYSITVSAQSDSICFGSSTLLDVSPNGPGYTYNWTPASGLSNPAIYNPVAGPAATATYSVTLTYPNGCRASDTLKIAVDPKPLAGFSNTSVCNTNATQFTNSSTTALGSITSWLWDFGDGTPLNNTESPSHIYAIAGSYNVTLIVNNNFGCADTITKSVQVYFNPTVGFIFNDVCFRDTMYFNNTSSVDNSTSIASYLWVFGDGGATSNVKDPSHYYSLPGTYNVTLVSTTANGCSSVANLSVKVFDAPANAFLFNNTCLFDSAVFTNTTLNPSVGSVASWSWNFGDGSPLNTTVWSPSHLYAAAGNYEFTLITYSSNLGCADTLKDSITVFPMPVANFGFLDVCLNQAMNFIDSSIVSIGTIAGVSWDFGDGAPLDTNPITAHTYASPGSYTVSLIVSTNNSCKDTVTKTVIVHPLPDAAFSTTNVCDGNAVPFNDLSTIPNTDNLQFWTWDFGDGSALNTNQNTSHLYAAKGSYSVQLLVVSNFGCVDSITKISIVNPNPSVSFTVGDTIGCEPLCVGFQNLSSIATGTYVQWAWDFGEGSTSSDPSHCYINNSVFLPEFFSVTLSVTSDSGCISALSKNNYITVYPDPSAGFTVDPQTAVVTDPVISIMDASAGANFWNWNFGDGTDTVSSFDPLPHTYADTGTYTIMLITSNQFSCLDTAYQTIIIEPDFLFYIPNAFSPNDDGINDTFSGRGLVITKYEMTIFDRWGNLIFFSDDMNKPWDGRANHGTEISQGEVYIYSFKVTDFNKKKHEYKGIVTLVR